MSQNRPGVGPSSVQVLKATVIDNGYCIGCGACSLGRSDSPLQIAMDRDGRLQAVERPGAGDPADGDLPVLEVCPFSGVGPDEDDLGAEVFGHAAPHDPYLGYALATYAGHVVEADYRERGSSGGLGTWILGELIRRDLVDAVLHVSPAPVDAEPGTPLFAYGVSRTIDAIRAGAKSRYYPVEMSEALRIVREQPGRYALIGVPCFIKAARRLARVEPLIRERIAFHVAIFCGHLKTAGFAEFLAWQCGVEPAGLRAVDFRKKLPGRPAHDYGVEATGLIDGTLQTRVAPVRELFGTDWSYGFFRYKACDYCEDVVGETADVSVGDAWLPRYVGDDRGTNAVVVRHPLIRRILEEATTEGRLELEPLRPEEVVESQAGGFRHRREGLSYRLYLADRARVWRPRKRIGARSWLSNPGFRRSHRSRMRLSAESLDAFRDAKRLGDLGVFIARMRPLIDRHRALLRPTAASRLKALLRRAASAGRRLLRR